MNGRERFNQSLTCVPTERPPLFEDGIRQEVLQHWYLQGLSKKVSLESLFSFDHREEIEPNLEPIPTPAHWPKSMDGLHKLSARLDPDDPKRVPEDWDDKVEEWRKRDYPLILRVHRGFFLTMGVHGWHRFTDAIQLLVDDPHLVESWLNLYAEFTSRLVERLLREVQVDAVLFSEPIGGNHGPLISPSMYKDFILKSYLPILQVAKSCGIPTIIYRTYANTRLLLPEVVKAGFNCLWACECNPEAMDYLSIRGEFGKDLHLIGGIDSDSLRHTREDIYRAVMDVVPPLLEGGGFIPLADGRVREDISFENYLYYRKLLELTTGSGN